ncbi:hypothetical protein [Pseudomonas syringae]|uniref:hypothetical protein n=1 Tax=Pseudomonas syringae TaxID=317 RepID=UPI0003027BA8|nr:hypothetical protein [Pseudomonas syringae]AQL40041.1 hypothetical protein JN853_28935 [Pseudomonas syringae pv. actinidiae ICMP 9853]EPM83609.1 hypothetical protein A260_24055 [Pseudomonas syringae pv. actinidiae ICMP 19068]EPM93821.1 hypothetical protein A258_23338 [Pseudomonas syringae pv. actinidiae ICMP 19104]EPN08337.1 hypothetical protein A252_23185 [Pseudomonas syringae pv. actinidiae ICMP 9855]KCU95251.1 hypothetical protein A250_25116 [Pseudomonas syringae pv. actinidiae ICMP 9617
MPDQAFSLDSLYEAIERHIRAAIVGLEYVGTMPDMLEQVAVPAVLIELVELEPGVDQGTGETALIARFEARVIVGAEREQCQQQAAFAASQLAVLLRLQTWGLDVEPSEFVRAAQDWSRPELDGYAVWVVEWTQGIYLGEEEWPWPNEPPGTLVFAFTSDTGRDSDDLYQAPEDM